MLEFLNYFQNSTKLIGKYLFIFLCDKNIQLKKELLLFVFLM